VCAAGTEKETETEKPNAKPTMLSAEQRELITAALDGELSETEVRALRQLLSTSPEARDLIDKLKADRERVRSLPLPQVNPPAELCAKIMARIADTTPAPRPKSTQPTKQTKPAKAPSVHPAQPAPARRRLPSWVPVALAASVLLCVAAGSFAFFTSKTPGNGLAKNPWSHVLPAPQEMPTSVPSPTQPAPQARPQHDAHAVAHVDISPVPVLPLPKEVRPTPIAIAPEPRSAKHDFLASGLLPPIPPFDLIQVRVPFLRTIAELEREDIRLELSEELARDLAYRLDLFVRDTARGVEVFQNAAKAHGLTVFADAATLDKLKKRQVHAVVIYSECLTAEELAVLFSKVAAEDVKFSPRVCDSLHATPTNRSDENELKQILGIDVGLYKRPTGSGGAGQGDKTGDKPVSSGTIDSVTKTLTTPSKVEKPVVLMTWQTTHPSIGRTVPAMSAELKQFREKRGERKPNVVPVIIVIRSVG
jgi:negative regulator of sigma E activity